MRAIPRSLNLIPVISAFGGLAIYQFEAFKRGVYEGGLDEGREVCEHVPLNMKLSSRGFKLFKAPKLVNLNSKTQRMTRILDILR